MGNVNKDYASNHNKTKLGSLIFHHRPKNSNHKLYSVNVKYYQQRIRIDNAKKTKTMDVDYNSYVDYNTPPSETLRLTFGRYSTDIVHSIVNQ
jgi:hypothetical protein